MIEFRPHIYLNNPIDDDFVLRILLHLSQDYKIIEVDNTLATNALEREVKITVEPVEGTHPDPEERIVTFTRVTSPVKETSIKIQVVDNNDGKEKGTSIVLHDHADKKPSQF